MNMIFKKKNKLKQKIRFADSFLAYRRNIFDIRRPVFTQFFLFKFCKIDADAVNFFLRIFLAVKR